MNTAIVYADPSGVWNYNAFDKDNNLIASGTQEGYDSYNTVMAAVGADLPGAVIAVQPVQQAAPSTPPAVVDEVPDGGAIEELDELEPDVDAPGVAN